MTLPSWNLNQFYESIEDNQINKDFKNLNSISKKLQNKYRGKLDSLSTLDERFKRFERDMDDLWMAIDATNPLGGN